MYYVCKMVVVIAALGGKKTIAVCCNRPGLEIESKSSDRLRMRRSPCVSLCTYVHKRPADQTRWKGQARSQKLKLYHHNPQPWTISVCAPPPPSPLPQPQPPPPPMSPSSATLFRNTLRATGVLPRPRPPPTPPRSAQDQLAQPAPAQLYTIIENPVQPLIQRAGNRRHGRWAGGPAANRIVHLAFPGVPSRDDHCSSGGWGGSER
jgi:hypothetical protein